MCLLFLLFFGIGCFGEELLPVRKGIFVRHTYYCLDFNKEHRQANWVYYELFPKRMVKQAARKDNFRVDPALGEWCATLSDYRKSGYDRGHLCPAADMTFSEKAMSETFYLSNMSPQTGALNRGLWADLEAIVRQMAVDNEKVYVVTGPVLTDGPFETIGENEVAVPHQYYKVVLDYTDPDIKAIGFVLPNDDPEEEITAYVRSVDEVEELTQLDFYPSLPDDVEQIVESEADPSRWSFRQFSSSSIPEDYVPGQISQDTGGNTRIQETFNAVFYEIKEEVFSILGLTDIAQMAGLI